MSLNSLNCEKDLKARLALSALFETNSPILRPKLACLFALYLLSADWFICSMAAYCSNAAGDNAKELALESIAG